MTGPVVRMPCDRSVHSDTRAACPHLEVLMNEPTYIVCSGCASRKLSEAVLIRDQPVILNYRFDSPKASAEVPLRTMELRQCWECGLVFNAAFEDGVVPYDKAYENRQSHSEAFAKHTMQVAKMIGAMMESERPRILEVGCGKGQFLRQVVGYCEG
jgi:hypothetical protein